MASTADIFAYVGGVFLSLCIVPQLVVVWRHRVSALASLRPHSSLLGLRALTGCTHSPARPTACARMQSAEGVSLLWILSYLLGLSLTLVYMVMLSAWAGAVPVIAQLVLGSGLLASKGLMDAGVVKPKPQASEHGDITVVSL
nr:hypothetical protein HK105_006167 [Polyrhizophydium stewartii]